MPGLGPPADAAVVAPIAQPTTAAQIARIRCPIFASVPWVSDGTTPLGRRGFPRRADVHRPEDAAELVASVAFLLPGWEDRRCLPRLMTGGGVRPSRTEAKMGEVGSRAQLVDASDLDARSHKIAATVPRDEIQEALRVEDGRELILDIARRENGDVQAHTLRVAWTEDQLEELLRETSGEQVTLVFDADELQQALIAEEDVEAHGVRRSEEHTSE